ncbi:MAG: Histidine kinase [Labilithrix sp.]|nr:Histidine kinase [Labilithrix sp.]
MERSTPNSPEARALARGSSNVAERQLAALHLAVSAAGTAIFPFAPHGPTMHPTIAYALLAMGWIFGLSGLVWRPYSRTGMVKWPWLTTLGDAGLSVLWVYATGGVESAWFVALFGSIITVSLRQRPRESIAAACFAAAGYVLMAVLTGQIHDHVLPTVVRVVFLVFVGAGTALIARERLRSLASRMRLLDLTQEVGQLGTWEWTLADGSVAWSEQLYQIFGVPSSFTPSFEAFVALIHPDDRPFVTGTIEDALKNAESFRFNHRLLLADGTIRWVHCRGRTVVGEDGRPVEMVGSTQDVTERRQMEDQLLLSGKLASLGTLASGIAHEINNPLAYVASNLDLLQRELGKGLASVDRSTLETMQEAVEAARHGSARMRDIVRGLKTFSRAESDERGPTDLARVAELSITVAAHEIGQRARLVRDYEETPPAFAHESRLSQVVMNLLVNAAHAIRPDPDAANEIRVRTHVGEPGRVCISVSDTGTGISPEHLPRIFDPFFTTNPTGGGTGLGLSICHGIVRDLGGEIAVTSTGPRGTTFTVSLPIAPVVATPPAAPVTREAPSPPSVPSRKRICVIDDEARYAESLRMLLAYDHEVALASSAERALEIFAESTAFDVIFCDLMMPGKTGMDLHAELAKAAPCLTARMIFLTGGATTDRAREFLARPGIRHLEKPVELEALEAMIAEVGDVAEVGS